MMEIIDLLRLGNVCLAGLAAGGMLMVGVAIIPARSSLPAGRALELWQLTTPRIDRSLAPAIVASGVLALLSLLLGDFGAAAQRYTLTGLAGTVGIAVMSARFYESRAYRAIASWSPESPPAEQPALFGRWNTMHGVRAGLALAAFAAYASAALAG
jgi:Domain of unknown function (DUF1772)